MRLFLALFLALLMLPTTIICQTTVSPASAVKSVQPSQTPAVISSSVRTDAGTNRVEPAAPDVKMEAEKFSPAATLPVKIPAGTKLDIEAAYTVSSLDLHTGDLITFRVLAPVQIDGAIAIQANALVTAQVVEAKRGGHWGKSGRLSWTMVDVNAADGTRVPIHADNPSEAKNNNTAIKGTGHGGEVATKTIIMGVLLAPLFPIAPLTLMHGFKRGEDAVIPRGKRYVVFVSSDASVKAVAAQ
ncbi:MAG: hypothetical protein ABJB61_07490 [bacterium]